MITYRKEIINPKVTKIGKPVVKFIDSTGKVYCKNCKWSGGWFRNSMTFSRIKGWTWCQAPVYEEIGSFDREYLEGKEFTGLEDVSGGKKKKTMSKADNNKDGKCPYYQRKWYRFWVK